MKRWIRRASVAFLAVLGLPVFADRADMERMAEDALLPYVRTTKPQIRQERLNANRQSLTQAAALRPFEEGSATVVFKAGRSIRQVSNFLADLPIVGAKFKAPLGDRGKIVSINVGTDDLYALHGTTEERLEYAISLNRARMERLAASLPDDEAQHYQQLIEEDQLLFSVDVIATISEIDDLANQASVAGVFLDDHDMKVRLYENVNKSPLQKKSRHEELLLLQHEDLFKNAGRGVLR